MNIPLKLLNYTSTSASEKTSWKTKDLRFGRILKSIIDSGETELSEVLYQNTTTWLKNMIKEEKSDLVISILKVA